MKNYVLLSVFCLSSLLAVAGDISEDDIEMLENRTKITSVYDEEIENEADEKFELIKFYTYQDENETYQAETQPDGYRFRVRVTVEMEDKEDNLYYARRALEQGPVHEDYTGRDRWEFKIPHGDLKRPKVTAYAIEYGILDGADFVVLSEEMDDVDSSDEIVERNKEENRLDDNSTLKHSYTYIDRDGEEKESPLQ